MSVEARLLFLSSQPRKRRTLTSRLSGHIAMRRDGESTHQEHQEGEEEREKEDEEESDRDQDMEAEGGREEEYEEGGEEGEWQT